jgi:hypothetical protein
MPAIKAIDQTVVDQAWADLISAYEAYPSELDNQDISDQDFITYSTDYFSGLTTSLDNLETVLGEVAIDPQYADRQTAATMLVDIKQLNVYYKTAISSLGVADWTSFYSNLEQATALENVIFAETGIATSDGAGSSDGVTIAYGSTVVFFFMVSLISWRWVQKLASGKKQSEAQAKRTEVFRASLWPLAGSLIALLVHLAIPDNRVIAWLLLGPVVYGLITLIGSYSTYRYENQA